MKVPPRVEWKEGPRCVRCGGENRTTKDLCAYCQAREYKSVYEHKRRLRNGKAGKMDVVCRRCGGGHKKAGCVKRLAWDKIKTKAHDRLRKPGGWERRFFPDPFELALRRGEI